MQNAGIEADEFREGNRMWIQMEGFHMMGLLCFDVFLWIGFNPNPDQNSHVVMGQDHSPQT